MAIRDYQRQWLDRVYAEWAAGKQHVFGTLPTGAGKTFSFVTAIREQKVPACITVHRSELLAQAALACNREKLIHNLEAPRELIRAVIKAQMELHGRSFYSERAPVHVASIQTLARRKDKVRWAKSIELVVNDEGHHLVTGGMYSDALSVFNPNARMLSVSAHCLRGDGLGLGRVSDGFADSLVVGPSARELIGRGFLSDYRVAIPQADLDLRNVPVGASGDFSHVRLAAAVHASKQLVGVTADSYCRLAGGKLALSFAVDIEHAGKISRTYDSLGVPNAIITGETPITERAAIMKQFRARRILQLISVEVLGEGTDVPDVEVVCGERPTASFQLFAQQGGRMMRVSVAPEYAAKWDTYTDAERLEIIAASAKPRGLWIDPCGNFAHHYARTGGPPCAPQEYTLLRVDRKARGKSQATPLRTCLNVECMQPYPRTLITCPYCSTAAPAPAGRATPEQVDGDLVLLDPQALTVIQREVAHVDGPAFTPKDAKPYVKKTIVANHIARQAAQMTLRQRMMVYGGWRLTVHGDERRAQREFYHTFAVDYLSAQSLNVDDATALDARIVAELERNNVSPVAAGVSQ
jgi:DNA repair protein RadD